MKIIFTAKGNQWDSLVDARFGRAEQFIALDTENNTLTTVAENLASGEAHGAGPKAATELAKVSPDIIITGNGPGGNAEVVLKRMNTKIYVGAADMTIKKAYLAFQEGSLAEF